MAYITSMTRILVRIVVVAVWREPSGEPKALHRGLKIRG
jgi:hypothetical protein